MDMQVLPAIDLLGDDAVRLERGEFHRVLFRQPLDTFLDLVIGTSPTMIHVVDLQGARGGTLRQNILERCVTRASPVAVQYSGGLRSVNDATRALELGAARVIVGTALWQRDDALADFVGSLGRQLVAALDVRDGQIAVRGWVESSHVTLERALERCVFTGVTRLHVTAIERDGTLQGPDLALYEQAVASGIAVVAAGGVRDERDLRALEEVGCEAAVMGVGYLARLGLGVSDVAESRESR